MTSIRRTLTLRLLCTLGLMMTVVALLLFLGVRAALVAQFDATLRARLATLEAATRWSGERVDLDYVSDAVPWYKPGPDAEYFQVGTEPGDNEPEVIVERSPSLESRTLLAEPGTNGAITNCRLPDGRAGRLATALFKPPPDEDLDAAGREAERSQAIATTPDVRITVAMGRGRLDAALRTIGLGLVLASGVMAMGLIVGVRLSLRAGLAPLQKLSSDVEQIRADTLSDRLPGVDLPDELRPVHARLNQLLERLEVAFAREQRFASAAAHELRTPVAELRSLIEVSVSRARTVESSRETMDEALRIIIRMEGLVRSLLALARQPDTLDPSRLPVIDLEPILRRVARRFELEATTRGGRLICACNDNATVRADPAALESILTNVVANAVEYAQPSPIVRIEAQVQEQGVVIGVTNPAPTVTRVELDRFFEPFWRSNESRTEKSHLGLGLSMVRALARSMGGDVSAQLRPGGLVQLCLTLQQGTELEVTRDPDAIEAAASSAAES